MGKTWIRALIAVVVLAAIAVGGWFYYDAQRRKRLPEGIVGGNGRIESVQVDVSTKYAGRVLEIFAEEGDLVKKGQVLAQMDVEELEAQLAGGEARIAEAQENENQIKAQIVERESMVRYQEQVYSRNRELYSRRVVSREELEQSLTKRDISKAAVDSVQAKLAVNVKTIEAARADVQNIQTQIADSTLISPVHGRVLYRLAEEREVLGAGGKILTLVNLDDVYMEIFLPAVQAARVQIGTEARIVLDANPQYYAPATVTFVSPEAQFTPKQVETRTERDKLVFRVKLKVPEEIILPHIERIKTGVRGMGYVRIDPDADWPPHLDQVFPPLVKGAESKVPTENDNETVETPTEAEPAPEPEAADAPVQPPSDASEPEPAPSVIPAEASPDAPAPPSN